MDKLAALNEILQLDPSNAFARYGLAMEHIARGNPDAALVEFDTLIAHSPNYVPAYQMSAQTFAKLGRIDAALEQLVALGALYAQSEATAGRPSTLWSAIEENEPEENEESTAEEDDPAEEQ